VAIVASSVMGNPIGVANPMPVALVDWQVVGGIQLLPEAVEMTFGESALPQHEIPFEAVEQAERAKALSLGEPQQQEVGAGIGLLLSLPSQSKANFWLHYCSGQTAMPAQTT